MKKRYIIFPNIKILLKKNILQSCIISTVFTEKSVTKMDLKKYLLLLYTIGIAKTTSTINNKSSLKKFTLLHAVTTKKEPITLSTITHNTILILCKNAQNFEQLDKLLLKNIKNNVQTSINIKETDEVALSDFELIHKS